MERAESMSRVLEAGYRMSLVPQDAASHRSVWSSTLATTGQQEVFARNNGATERNHVIRFFAFDPDNASSIHSCLCAARKNGWALRGTITSEMWKTLNTTWLEFRDIGEDDIARRGYPDLFDWVKERASLFRGITDDTMLRDDAHAFVRVGWCLERAANTARLLDAKYHVLLASAADVGGAVDYYQWGAVLRSVGALRAYHKIYDNEITPRRVAELLMLREDMPRSMLACFNRLIESLDELCTGRHYECRCLAGDLHESLRYAHIKEIFDTGLHEYLTGFVDRVGTIGTQIQRDFMMIA